MCAHAGMPPVLGVMLFRFASISNTHLRKRLPHATRCVCACQVAIMFTLYELAGVVTNLAAGMMGARWGIKWTLLSGLTLQLAGIGMLYGWQVGEQQGEEGEGERRGRGRRKATWRCRLAVHS